MHVGEHAGFAGSAKVESACRGADLTESWDMEMEEVTTTTHAAATSDQLAMVGPLVTPPGVAWSGSRGGQAQQRKNHKKKAGCRAQAAPQTQSALWACLPTCPSDGSRRSSGLPWLWAGGQRATTIISHLLPLTSLIHSFSLYVCVFCSCTVHPAP